MKSMALTMLTLAVLNAPVYAQMTNNDCDETVMDCSSGSVKEPNKQIYPFKPFELSLINQRVTYLTENPNFLRNVREMEARGLNKRNTTNQPWGGSFWPLYQGMIANDYQEKDYTTFFTDGFRAFSWKANVKNFKKRKSEFLPKVNSLDEKDLAKLAPSEKYDLLMGDASFDLTSRIWAFAEKWGNEKKWGFLSAIDLPEGYRIPEANTLMALWEGICHGWAVAAGHSPRPEKTVWVTLPTGKKMPFYPNDIKALVSLMWANSTIQSNVMFEGNRCNKKHPDQDKYGRYIDTEKDKFDTELLPRCADVHPGIFHLSVVNILGIEGRSFVADMHAQASVGNQPVSGYELEYFNPKTGKTAPVNKAIISRAEFGKKDKYSANRNPNSTHIVGVSMKFKYVNWEYPKKGETNSISDDKIKHIAFNYDLELDAEGNVIGGQWRVGRKIGDSMFGIGTTDQPDFFWVVPKDWKNYFKGVSNLPAWNLTSGQPAPVEYKEAAANAHNYVYEESKFFFGSSPKCPVIPVEGQSGPSIMVDCEFRYPKPQPLINVVNQLLDMSKQ